MFDSSKIDPFKKIKTSIEKSLSESSPKKTKEEERTIFRNSDEDQNGVWTREEMAGAVAELYGIEPEEVIESEEFNDYFDEMENSFADENSPNGITLKDFEVSTVNSELCEFFGVDEINQINEIDNALYYKHIQTYINDVNNGNPNAIDKLYSSVEEILYEEEQLEAYAEAYPEFENFMISTFGQNDDGEDVSLIDLYRSGRIGNISDNNNTAKNIFETFQQKEAEKLEYDALIQYCNENNIEVPEDILPSYKGLTEENNGNSYYDFQQGLKELKDKRTEFLDSLGINSTSEVDENGFVTNTKLEIEYEDGTTYTIVYNYSVDENNKKYISGKTETMVYEDDTTETLTTVYQQNGIFVTKNSDGEVVDENITNGENLGAALANIATDEELANIFKAADENNDNFWSQEEMAKAIGNYYGIDEEQILNSNGFEEQYKITQLAYRENNKTGAPTTYNGITTNDIAVFGSDSSTVINSEEDLLEFLGVEDLDDCDFPLYNELITDYQKAQRKKDTETINQIFLQMEIHRQNELKLQNYAKLQGFEEIVHKQLSMESDITSLTELYRANLLKNTSIEEIEIDYNSYKKQKNIDLEYEAIIRYCNENGIEVPEDIYENQTSLITYSTLSNYDLLYYPQYLFLDEIGVETIAPAYDENGCITKLEWTKTNEDDSTSTISFEYEVNEDGERYISSRTEIISKLGQENRTLIYSYSEDGSYTLFDSAKKITDNSLETNVKSVATSSNKANESIDGAPDNLGDSSLTNFLKNTETYKNLIDKLDIATGANDEMTRILFNSIFESDDVKLLTNGADIYIDKNNTLYINGKKASASDKNILDDKEHLLINAIYEYRNGKYVIDDNILEKASEASAKYDIKGNLTSYTQYFVNDNGEIGQVEISYSYDSDGNTTKQTSIVYDANGNVTCKDETTFDTDGDNIVVTTTRTDATGKTQPTKTETIEEFQLRTRNEAIARKYTDRIDLTEEELGYVLTIDYLTNSNSQNKDTLLGQDYDEGIFSQGYNLFKETTGWGPARSEITTAIDQNSQKNQALIDAINTPGADFKAIYQDVYGVEYDQNRIDDLRMQEAAIQLYSSSQSEITGISTMLDEFYYSDFDGDEQKRRTSIISVLEYAYQKPEYMTDEEYDSLIEEKYTQYIEEKELIADFSTVLVENEGVLAYTLWENNESYSSYYEEQVQAINFKLEDEEITEEEFEQLINSIPTLPEYSVQKMAEGLQDTGIEERFIEIYGEEEGLAKYQEYLVTVFNTCSHTTTANKIEKNINNATTNCIYDDLMTNLNDNMATQGFNPTTLVEDYNTNCGLAFGESYNDINDILQKYISSQQGVDDTVTKVLQGVGTLCIIGGCIVATYASGGTLAPILFKAGQVITLTTIFGKDAYDFIEEATSKNCSDEEINAIVKDAIQDMALYYSGRLIGKCSNWLHGKVDGIKIKGESISKFWGYSAEIAADTGLSLLADYGITGSVDLQGEGFSQMLALWSGISTEKFAARQNTVNTAKNEAYIEVVKGNPDGAMEKLLAVGFSSKKAAQLVDSFSPIIEPSIPGLSITRSGSKYNLEITEAGQTRTLEYVDDIQVDGQPLKMYYDEQTGISYSIDADGHVKSSSYPIETDGKIIQVEKQYNAKGEISGTFIINDNGIPMELKPVSTDGKTYYEAFDTETGTNYKFDANEKLISETKYDTNNNIVSETKYEYDENGVQTKTTIATHEYNDGFIKIELADSDGTILVSYQTETGKTFEVNLENSLKLQDAPKETIEQLADLQARGWDVDTLMSATGDYTSFRIDDNNTLHIGNKAYTLPENITPSMASKCIAQANGDVAKGFEIASDYKSMLESMDIAKQDPSTETCAMSASLSAMVSDSGWGQYLLSNIVYNPESGKYAIKIGNDTYEFEYKAGENVVEAIYKAYTDDYSNKATTSDFMQAVLPDSSKLLLSSTPENLATVKDVINNGTGIVTFNIGKNDTATDINDVEIQLSGEHAYVVSKVNDDGSVILKDTQGEEITVSKEEFERISSDGDGQFAGRVAGLNSDITDGVTTERAVGATTGRLTLEQAYNGFGESQDFIEYVLNEHKFSSAYAKNPEFVDYLKSNGVDFDDRVAIQNAINYVVTTEAQRIFPDGSTNAQENAIKYLMDNGIDVHELCSASKNGIIDFYANPKNRPADSTDLVQKYVEYIKDTFPYTKEANFKLPDGYSVEDLYDLTHFLTDSEFTQLFDNLSGKKGVTAKALETALLIAKNPNCNEDLLIKFGEEFARNKTNQEIFCNRWKDKDFVNDYSSNLSVKDSNGVRILDQISFDEYCLYYFGKPSLENIPSHKTEDIDVFYQGYKDYLNHANINTPTNLNEPIRSDFKNYCKLEEYTPSANNYLKGHVGVNIYPNGSVDPNDFFEIRNEKLRGMHVEEIYKDIMNGNVNYLKFKVKIGEETKICTCQFSNNNGTVTLELIDINNRNVGNITVVDNGNKSYDVTCNINGMQGKIQIKTGTDINTYNKIFTDLGNGKIRTYSFERNNYFIYNDEIYMITQGDTSLYRIDNPNDEIRKIFGRPVNCTP